MLEEYEKEMLAGIHQAAATTAPEVNKEMEFQVRDGMVEKVTKNDGPVGQTVQLLVARRKRVTDRIQEIELELRQLKDEDERLQVAVETLRKL
jgi:hypothetical protein